MFLQFVIYISLWLYEFCLVVFVRYLVSLVMSSMTGVGSLFLYVGSSSVLC